MIQLPDDFYADQRGNTVLTSEEGDMLIAWITLDGTKRLEVSYVRDNYPALTVKVIDSSNEVLANHINHNCQDWVVKSCNVPGVKLVQQGKRIACEDADG